MVRSILADFRHATFNEKLRIIQWCEKIALNAGEVERRPAAEAINDFMRLLREEDEREEAWNSDPENHALLSFTPSRPN